MTHELLADILPKIKFDSIIETEDGELTVNSSDGNLTITWFFDMYQVRDNRFGTFSVSKSLKTAIEDTRLQYTIIISEANKRIEAIT